MAKVKAGSPKGAERPKAAVTPDGAVPSNGAPAARPADELGGLRHLGGGKADVPGGYDPGLLEAIRNACPERDCFVDLRCPEFTSLCPKTGQPDFAEILISYVPDGLLVESKSLKLYLFGFRNHGAFHEDCVGLILGDLVALLSPRYMEVTGLFAPRGGISICPYANYGAAGSERWEAFASDRLAMHGLGRIGKGRGA